jgi:eukaryotic-like serine/threonine-protein kinase
MSPARWGKIEEIYHAALARDAAARAAYLDSACGSDSELRAEVESLLESELQAQNFLETQPSAVTQTSMLGRKVGPYRIVSQIGAGGMGEVYRAHDTKLGRDVALKTLPLEFAADPERLARFRREARTLASLNHPNIAAIYGLEESEGTTCLVLELVEGETLYGPLPVEQALDYARQVAEALEAAHAKGIMHRDLKPANVKVTPQGRVKVLDFGLAKAIWGSGEKLDLSQQVTMTALETVAGQIAGTPPYMSPEQTRGQAVDQRTDIWAFGCLLYELLSGKRAFRGDTVPEIWAAVLERQPDWAALPSKAHAKVRALLQRCLQKDIGRRVQDIREARRVLEEEPRKRSRPAAVADTESIAILPSAELPDFQYIADGISEGITRRLAQIPNLRVAPWTMVLRHPMPEQDYARTAGDLGVRTLFTVKLTARGGTYEVRTEWMDPMQREHLWGARYERNVHEFHDLEDEITMDLAERIAPHLRRSQVTEIRKFSATDGKAYELYLKGRHLWNKRTVDPLTKAIQHYQRSLDRDPGFALAFAGIADCYLTLGTFEFTSPALSLPRAKAAATRALELAPALVETRTTLGCLYAFYDWDWDRAEREFQMALASAPNYSVARQWYGASLCAKGRFAAGRKQLRAALELDPLSAMIGTQFAVGCYVERQYEEAARECRNVLDLDPHFWAAWHFLGLCLEALGRLSDAIASLQKAVDLSADTPIACASLAHALAGSGRRADAERMWSTLQSRSQTEYVPPFSLALTCCGLGRLSDALAYLEQAHEDRSPSIALWSRGERRLDPLRSEPRFERILQSAGLA